MSLLYASIQSWDSTTLWYSSVECVQCTTCCEWSSSHGLGHGYLVLIIIIMGQFLAAILFNNVVGYTRVGSSVHGWPVDKIKLVTNE